jgi:hypothetical protein
MDIDLCASTRYLQKIRSRTRIERVATLEQIISVERTQRRKIATEAINWLLLYVYLFWYRSRALGFTSESSQADQSTISCRARILNFGLKAYQMNLASSTKEELSVSFTRVWDQEYCKSSQTKT